MSAEGRVSQMDLWEMIFEVVKDELILVVGREEGEETIGKHLGSCGGPGIFQYTPGRLRTERTFSCYISTG